MGLEDDGFAALAVSAVQAGSGLEDREAEVDCGSGCRDCGKQFNERSGGVLNRTQYPSDVIALVVLWRLRYKLALRDLPEMFRKRRRVDLGDFWLKA